MDFKFPDPLAEARAEVDSLKRRLDAANKTARTWRGKNPNTWGAIAAAAGFVIGAAVVIFLS